METIMRAGAVPWPPELAADYVKAGYWRQRPLGSLPWEWAERHGTKTALVDGQVRLSYRELAAAADGLASELASAGLRPGDNVLIQLPNCWEFIVLLFACLRLGVAPLLALMPFRTHELTQLVQLAEARACFVPARWQEADHQELAAEVARSCGLAPLVAVLGEPRREGHLDLRAMLAHVSDGRDAELDRLVPDPGDVALFLLSGGTTGVPKIISRTHNDYEYNARCSAAACDFGPGTVYLAMLPAAHNFTLGSPGILGTLMTGGTVVLAPSPEPERAFGLISRESVTVTSAVPAVVRRWLQAAQPGDPRLASLRVLQVGGSIFPPELAAQVTPVLGCGLQQVFGMAEGLLCYTRLDDPEEVILTTQGRPVSPADEILILSVSGGPAAQGTAGELLTRGPYTPRGYFAAAEYNRHAFAAGWYRTGDIAWQDPSGNLIVEGRSKDLINIGGEKVSAAEIEALVRGLAQVADAAAVPAPDPELGEQVAICVVLRAGAVLTLDEVRAELTRQGVADFKIPRLLEIVATLPLTPIGKIDKTALRHRLEAPRAERETAWT
jgi:2,3-dihydroxybenzoate-AMP ligase